MTKEEFKEACATRRDDIAGLVAGMSSLKGAINENPPTDGENRGEVMANITLSLRHLEDASMRLGKAIQASEGGVSPLGGPSTPSAA